MSKPRDAFYITAMILALAVGASIYTRLGNF